jgi:formylmethanofuran dehydrogenase subunit E
MSPRNTLFNLMDAMAIPRGGCETCGEVEFSPNVEAFEETGQIMCDECAEALFEEIGYEFE